VRIARLARVKRRILLQAVEENLAAMCGRPPRRLARRHRFAPGRVLRVVLAAAVPLGLLPLYVLTAEEQVPLASLTAPAGGPWAGRRGAAPAPELTPRFAVPAAGGVLAGAFPLAVRRVIVDPGHGGDSDGTRGTAGMLEKDLTLDIARRLTALLENAGLETVLTRDADIDLPLAERAGIANAAAGDVFVSIHLNWFADAAARGVETFYLGPAEDPDLVRLAAVENRDSGYSLADLRRILEAVYADARQEESRRLAEAVHRSLLGAARRDDPGAADRGVKTAPFVVLVATEMPAVLAEVSCLSNAEELARLRRASYRQAIAEALAAGVRAFAETREPERS
jgi:N-acetylmuramoyl-L-alanine amidase